MNELDEFSDKMHIKNLEIIEEDQLELNMLMELNKQIIYSRIEFCFSLYLV